MSDTTTEKLACQFCGGDVGDNGSGHRAGCPTGHGPRTMTATNLEELRQQHRRDAEVLMAGPDLLAAARRAHTLLVNIEVDAGEYYRETAWLAKSIEAAELQSRRSSSTEKLAEALRDLILTRDAKGKAETSGTQKAITRAYYQEGNAWDRARAALSAFESRKEGA